MEAICEICGSIGFVNALVNCVKCELSARHCYCLDQLPKILGDDNIIWTCEDCLTQEVEPCIPVNPNSDPSNCSGLACRSFHIHANEGNSCRHNSVPFQPTTNATSDIAEQCDNCLSLPIRGPIWRGNFSLSNENFGTVYNLAAHLSKKAFTKAFECSRLLPNMIPLQLYPRLELWPNNFHILPPTDEQIVYFLPQGERDESVYRELLGDMVNHDLAMKAVIGDTELIVFTSVQRPEQCQRFKGKHYLWGDFRGWQPASFCNLEDNSVPSDSVHNVQTGNKGSLTEVSVAEGPHSSPVHGEWCASVPLIPKDISMEAGKIGEGLVGVNNHMAKLPSNSEKLENASSVSDEIIAGDRSSCLQQVKLQKTPLIADLLGDEECKECYIGRKELNFDTTLGPDWPLMQAEEPVVEQSARGTRTRGVTDMETLYVEEDAAVERTTIRESIFERVIGIKHATRKSFKSTDFQETTKFSQLGGVIMDHMPHEELVKQKSMPQGNGERPNSGISHSNSESICKSVLNMAYAFHEETNVDEANSVDDSLSHVGPYSVDLSLGPILEDIIGKYGDIARDCIFRSNSIRSSQLQGLCMTIKELKETPFDQLRAHNLKTFEDAITTAETVNLDVKWLRCRHEELKNTLHGIFNVYNCNMKNALAAAEASVQCTNMILDQKNAQLMKLQAELQLMETQMEPLPAEIEITDSKMDNPIIRYKQFHKSLVEGLL